MRSPDQFVDHVLALLTHLDMLRTHDPATAEQFRAGCKVLLRAEKCRLEGTRHVFDDVQNGNGHGNECGDKSKNEPERSEKVARFVGNSLHV